MTEDFQVLSHVKCTLPIAHFCSGLNPSLADELAMEYSRQTGRHRTTVLVLVLFLLIGAILMSSIKVSTSCVQEEFPVVGADLWEFEEVSWEGTHKKINVFYLVVKSQRA